jgi:hypothetical protein
MRLGVRRIAFLLALVASVACSLTTDLTGFSEPFPFEAGSSDAPVLMETSTFDGGVEAAIEAAPPSCLPQLTIDTPLTTTAGTWSARSYKNAGYPKVESFFGSPAAVLLPFVDTTPIPIDGGAVDGGDGGDAGPAFFIPPERMDAIGGIWLTTPVALRSFDLELEIYVKCTKSGSCADGVGVAWLDTTSVASLTNTNTGNVLGFPTAVTGGAVLADVYHNLADETTDPPVPALEIVKIEASKNLGHYPWAVASIGVDFRGAWHRLAISVRGDAVTVHYDGTRSFIGNVPSVTKGLVGISAGTGGETEAVAVRNVKASFYDCAP